jgi:hypothetical protein
VSARVPDIVCIAQTTLVVVNNALLVNDRRLLFFWFDLRKSLKMISERSKRRFLSLVFILKLFIQHSIIEYSTSTFLSPHYFCSVTKTQPRSQGFNMAAIGSLIYRRFRGDGDVESD